MNEDHQKKTEPVVTFKQPENSLGVRAKYMRNKRTRNERETFVEENQPLIDAYNIENLGKNVTRMTEELEKVVIHEKDIPESYLKLKNDLIAYFQVVAEDEHIPLSESFDVQFVPPKAISTAQKNSLLRQHGYKPIIEAVAIAPTETQTVYVTLLDETDDNIFQTGMMIMHELRHATSRKKITLSPNYRFGNIRDIGLGLTDMSALTKHPFRYMEELYTAGYVEAHMSEIQNEVIQEKLQEKTGEVKTIEEANGYSVLVKTFNLLASQIDDFEQLCVNIRRGDKGAKGILSREIVKHFGREGLAVLMTANEITAHWAHKAMELALKRKEHPDDETLKLALEDEMKAVFMNVNDNKLTENLYRSFNFQ